MKRLLAALIGRPYAKAIACGLLVALSAVPAHAQNCLPRPDGLIAWWPLDGTPNDIVGKNNPSSVAGVNYKQGQVLQGATFSQTPPSTGIRIPQGLLTPAKFTIDAWVQVSGPGPDGNGDYHGAYIIAKPLSAYWPVIALTWVASNYTFRFEFGTWGSNHNYIDTAGTGAIGPLSYGPDGVFHHVVGTYDGTYYRLYVDGDLKSSLKDTTPVNYNAGTPWVIGANYYTNSAFRTFNGIIDEVHVFDRALDQRDIQALYAAHSAGICKSQLAKGMTWRWGGVNATNGTVIVGCGASDTVHPCNGYVGDQSCADSLPLLCFKPNPILPKPRSVVETPYYYLWSGGIVGTTAPVAPAMPPINGSLASANLVCEQEFGKDWRVAEFHDGAQGKGGWDFLAYGNVADTKTRFWVHINDQPKGTCFTKK